jgi:hypothetical protein
MSICRLRQSRRPFEAVRLRIDLIDGVAGFEASLPTFTRYSKCTKAGTRAALHIAWALAVKPETPLKSRL